MTLVRVNRWVISRAFLQFLSFLFQRARNWPSPSVPNSSRLPSGSNTMWTSSWSGFSSRSGFGRRSSGSSGSRARRPPVAAPPPTLRAARAAGRRRAAERRTPSPAAAPSGPWRPRRRSPVRSTPSRWRGTSWPRCVSTLPSRPSQSHARICTFSKQKRKSDSD